MQPSQPFELISFTRGHGYPTERSNDWVKKTCAQRETLTIAAARAVPVRGSLCRRGQSSSASYRLVEH
jgi:hypothetical protein